jgi:hypothetical protein
LIIDLIKLNFGTAFVLHQLMKPIVVKYLFVFALVAGLLFSAFRTQDEIYPEQLDWDSHFLASPDLNSPYAALTVTNWHYSYSSTIRNNHLHIDFKFTGGVVPSESWVKSDRISNRKISRLLLNHEQGHVYINFILLKDGEITVRNQKYTPSNYKRLIQATANKVGKYYSDMQSRYDIETKHGSDLAAQSRWDSYLQNEMAKFN